MMFRPRAASWFDLLVPRDGVSAVLESLARSGAVELESSADETALSDLSTLRQGLGKFADLAQDHRAYWPQPAPSGRPPSVAPLALMDKILDDTEQWVAEAAPLIREAQDCIQEQADLRLLRELVSVAAGALPRPSLLAGEGPVLDVSIFLSPGDRLPDRIPPDVMTRRFLARSGTFLLAVGPKESMARLTADLEVLKARRIHVSPGLPDDAAALTDFIAARLDDLAARHDVIEKNLEALNRSFHLAELQTNVRRLQWLLEHAKTLPTTENFVRITGWTEGRDALEKALAGLDVAYALNVGGGPLGVEPPMFLHNPTWVKPFEIFVRLIGVPAALEADPSAIVALIAPLLFGFMFGDVGQGAVLIVVGLALRGRYPLVGILVPGGIFSMAFGVAFGSVFAQETVIPALWVHPLDNPVFVLQVSIAAGAAILMTGLLLSALESYWQRRGVSWWMTQAGVVLAYIGVLASFATLWALVATLAGAFWFVLGSVLLAAPERRMLSLGEAVGKLIESLFQLLVNTLSFVRVGAFAVAHAGLSVVVVALAETAGGVGYWVVMIVGNVFIIALEGLIVGIQTTRLLLFEFFIRFFKAGGRAFRALPAPDQNHNAT